MTKIAMVNYLNSKPFGYGFDHYSGTTFDINLMTPAKCAESFASGQCDIALVPVGALLTLGNYKIVSEYCIGSEDEVRTVCVFSHRPLGECIKIYLDDQSRTSVLLCQMILEKYLDIHLPYVSSDVQSITLSENEAVLMIGDKVFDIEDQYAFKLDLGKTWRKWQKLPFAYAVWIAKPYVKDETIEHLNRALALGMSHIRELSASNPAYADYFSKNISYFLSPAKKTSIDLYLSIIKEGYV